MLADGLKLNTRRQVCNTLRQLNRHVDLMNTEAVKTTICPPTINKNTHKLKTNITTFAHNRTQTRYANPNLKENAAHKPMKLNQRGTERQ